MKKPAVLFMVLGLALVALPVLAQDVPDANANIFSNAANNNDNSVVQGQTQAGAQIPIIPVIPTDLSTESTEPNGNSGQGGGVANSQNQNAANNGSTAQQGFGNDAYNTNSENEAKGKVANAGGGTATDNSINVEAKNAANGSSNINDVSKGGTLQSGTGNINDSEAEKGGVLQSGTQNIGKAEVEKGGVLNSGSGTVDQSETTNVAVSDSFKKGKYVQNSAAVTENNQKGKTNINGANSAPIYEVEGKYAINGANSAPINDASGKDSTIVTGSGNAIDNKVDKEGVLQNGSGNIAGIKVDKEGTLTNGNDNAIGNKDSVVDSTFNTAISVPISDSFKKGKYVQSNNNNEQKGKNNNYSGTQTNYDVEGKYANATGTQTVNEVNHKQCADGKNVNNSGTQTVNEVNVKQKGKNVNYSGTQTNTENNWDAKGKYAINGVGTVTEVNNKGKYVKSVIFKDDLKFENETKTSAPVSAKNLNNLQAISTTQLSQVNAGVVVGDYSPNTGNVAVSSSGTASQGVVASAYNGGGVATNQAALNVVNVAYSPNQALTASPTLTFTKYAPPPSQ